jgi:hypothetical protein
VPSRGRSPCAPTDGHRPSSSSPSFSFSFSLSAAVTAAATTAAATAAAASFTGAMETPAQRRGLEASLDLEARECGRATSSSCLILGSTPVLYQPEALRTVRASRPAYPRSSPAIGGVTLTGRRKPGRPGAQEGCAAPVRSPESQPT